jgi:hypothetical protein
MTRERKLVAKLRPIVLCTMHSGKRQIRSKPERVTEYVRVDTK